MNGAALFSPLPPECMLEARSFWLDNITRDLLFGGTLKCCIGVRR
jgi:hypothetical protein